MMKEFQEFMKIARLSRMMTITEKIDGTNASILIEQDGTFLTGSRTRWITPEDDNFGFSRWAHEHKDELLALGPGHHFGEWWGSGIQRKYGQAEKHWSLFNTAVWLEDFDNARPICPPCCRVVPVLYRGIFDTAFINSTMTMLLASGSIAGDDGFSDPEGVVIYHEAARIMFKKTFKKDEGGKGQS
jgi:hypothetical protein